MPYIKFIDKFEVHKRGAKTSGELNFHITTLILNYLGDNYNYQKINDVIGALESCKLEFYRRLVVPYEEKKIKENGDVYDKSE